MVRFWVLNLGKTFHPCHAAPAHPSTPPPPHPPALLKLVTAYTWHHPKQRCLAQNLIHFRLPHRNKMHAVASLSASSFRLHTLHSWDSLPLRLCWGGDEVAPDKQSSRCAKLVVVARGAQFTHLLCCVCVKAVRCQLGVNTCCCVVDGGARRTLLSIDCGRGGGGGGNGQGLGWVGWGGSTHFAVQRVRRKRQKLKPKTTKNPFARAFRISKLGSDRLRFTTGCCVPQAAEIRLKTEKKKTNNNKIHLQEHWEFQQVVMPYWFKRPKE